MTSLEDQMYLALLGGRPIISATANVNPSVFKRLALVDRALEAYKRQKSMEAPPDAEELQHAAGE